MVKRLLRTIAIHLAALFLVTHFVAGFKINGGIQIWIIAGIAFSFIRIFLHPLLKILLIPINLLTLQTMGIIVYIIALYVFVALIPQVNITSFTFPALNLGEVTLPSIYFTPFMTAAITAFGLSFVSRILTWFCS